MMKEYRSWRKRGSQWMLNLQEGNKAQFFGPMGVFTYNHSGLKRKVLVATGTGIAPFRAMVLHHLKNGGADDLTLYWGLRYEEDIFLDPEFSQLAREYPNFHYILTLSKPTPAWTRASGRVTDHVFTQVAKLPEAEFYLCGSKFMIEEMNQKLLAQGVPKAQIRMDIFY